MIRLVVDRLLMECYGDMFAPATPQRYEAVPSHVAHSSWFGEREE